MKENMFYAGSAINFLVGIIFLLTAFQCALPLVVAVVGILSLAKGVALLVGGPKKLASRTKWIQKQSITVLRLIMIVSLGIGILIIYAA